MRARHRSVVLALVATVATVGAACGSDESSDSASTSPPATQAPADTPAATEPPETEPPTTDAPTTDAPSSEPPASEPASGSAGTLTLYSGRNEALLAGLIEQFEADTGIDVEVRYGSSAEMGAALLEEGENTPADVFYSQEVGAVGMLAREGLLSSLPDEVVALADERFQPAEGNHWVGVTGRSRVIVYNPDLVPSPPAGVLELTDPQWDGQVAIVPGNAGFQAFITGFRATQGEDAARQWLTDMIDNGVVTDIESNGDVLAAVNDGQIPMGLINHYYWGALAEELGAENMTAELIFPKGDDPGGLFNATAVGITKNGAANPAALAFVEYLLSPEGQAYFVEQTFEYPVIEGVDGPAGYPAREDLEGPALDLTDLDSLAATQALLTELGLLS